MVKKSMKKLFVGLAVLSTMGTLSASSASVSAPEAFSTSKGFFQPRPASANIAREMMMEPATKHRNSEGWYGEFSATGFYQRSWNQAGADTAAGSAGASAVSAADSVAGSASGSFDQGFLGLGAMPFWSGTNVMNLGVATAIAPVPGQPVVDTYQFGLGNATANAAFSTDTHGTTGTVALSPIVYQAGSDFMFIVGSSANEPGFLFKIKAPVAVYNINPQLIEIAPTAVAYNQGQLAQTDAPVADPNATMAQAFAGVTGAGTAQGNFKQMQFGLINGDISTGAKFGDIEMTAGYSFVSNEDNSFTVALRASAPTGNKATGKYMLEPIVGRGGCWGLGGYAAGHVSLWEGNNDNRLTFKFMSDVMHLFETDTVRSYDLKANGAGSKYMLVANYAGATAANVGTFNGTIQNAINLTTLNSNSSFGVEGEVAVAFNYAGRGWSLDLGYDFYGRSSETLTIEDTFAANTWGVLGHQGPGISGAGVTPSNAVQPFATMQSAQAQVGTALLTTNYTVVTSTATGSDQIGTPVTGNLIGSQTGFIGNAALDIAGAAQAAMLTSKVFSKIAYEWENSDYVPFLGVLGEFEFSNCLNNALPQWSVAIVGGVSF